MTPLAPDTADAAGLSALVALLQKQRAIYVQLRQLSDQQATLIVDGQAEPLLTLLSQRQKLIDDAALLNADLEPYRKKWASLWAGLGDKDRETIGALVREVQELLGAIVQQDERDRQSLQAAKGKLGSELQKLSRAAGAVNAYRQAPSGQNRFTNKQG
ncbi:MAG: flagellar export chaperone FlgN [Planctomycetota bacterium]|nr:flagellar export chaperone FlgN [Planctomycetota bacterium]